MTAPLTPANCDLQDFPFMPLHVARLRDSDLASEESPEACWYAVLLWAASWHQLPAASLPDNDAVLTKLIGLGRDVKTFKKHRAAALRGFVLCDDGRLYHPVVAERALISWKSKLEQRWRTECGRIKKQNQRNSTDLPLPTFEEFLSLSQEGACPVNVPHGVPGDIDDCPEGQTLQGRGRGRGRGNSSVSDETGADAPPSGNPDPLAVLRALEPKTGAWRLALKVLMDRGGFSEARARPIIGKWSKEIDDPAALWRFAEAAWDAATLDPVSYITAAIIRGAEAGTGVTAPSEVRQRAWMDEFAAAPTSWKPGDRGPRPGEPGCRVSPSIQREFGIEPAAEQGRAA